MHHWEGNQKAPQAQGVSLGRRSACHHRSTGACSFYTRASSCQIIFKIFEGSLHYPKPYSLIQPLCYYRITISSKKTAHTCLRTLQTTRKQLNAITRECSSVSTKSTLCLISCAVEGFSHVNTRITFVCSAMQAQVMGEKKKQVMFQWYLQQCS